MATQALLSRLTEQISQLTASVQLLPQKENVSRRFNYQLFHSRGNQLEDYQNEILANLSYLEQMIEQQGFQQVTFLAEKLVMQIEALQREIATLALRRQESDAFLQKKETQHQRLAQYRGYQRRLQQMIAERESELQDNRQSHPAQQQSMQITREIIALQGRLARCCAALHQLEKQIEHGEYDYYEPSS